MIGSCWWTQRTNRRTNRSCFAPRARHGESATHTEQQRTNAHRSGNGIGIGHGLWMKRKCLVRLVYAVAVRHMTRNSLDRVRSVRTAGRHLGKTGSASIIA